MLSQDQPQPEMILDALIALKVMLISQKTLTNSQSFIAMLLDSDILQYLLSILKEQSNHVQQSMLSSLLKAKKQVVVIIQELADKATAPDLKRLFKRGLPEALVS